MKKIDAIIRPEKLDRVSDALNEKGHYAMTVSDVHGRGEQRGIRLQFRGKEVMVDLIPKIKVEMVVDAAEAEEVVAIIQDKAYTGENGDGKIFVYDIEKSIQIRTA